MKMSKIFSFVFTLLFLITIYQSCIEQIDAEFDLQSGIIFIDAYALTEQGVSSVAISKSTFENENFKVVNVSNATVKVENINTGEMIDFSEDDSGTYVCPANFAASVGEVWKLHVEFEDGKRVESKQQTVNPSVPLGNVQAAYSPEVEFNIEFDRFIPGHRLSIDWQDPEGEENYYLWKYRTFEPLIVCKTCLASVLRNGECVGLASPFGPPYYNYPCIPDCWEISFGKELPIFHDRLEDGTTITDREVAILPYYRRPSILVEIQQYSLNKSAYEYFKVINSQVSESGSLNAPPPAALLGNLFNPDDSSDLILGQFTAAGLSTKRIFIDRSQIIEPPIRPSEPLILETCNSCPTSAPCVDSFTRTASKPDGWP